MKKDITKKLVNGRLISFIDDRKIETEKPKFEFSGQRKYKFNTKLEDFPNVD
jgi:hypothetical protein